MTPYVVVLEKAPRLETFQVESVIDIETVDAGDFLLEATRPNLSYEHNQIIIMQDMDDKSTVGPDETGTYPNGYRFPKKHTWSQSIVIGLRAFWKFLRTPVGLLITIYGLNIVGWGAMIFFVLLTAAPAMCHPTCGDRYSARKIWIEIDGQVLTALFCITGFGLIPWRIRDFYYLLKWRLGKDQRCHRKLAGINRGWYRLPGSQELPTHIAPPPIYDKRRPQAEDDPPPCSAAEIKELEDNDALPLPPASIPEPPLTGVRARPTKTWKMDALIWTYVVNTLIQIALAGIMWGLNRFNRPSWATGSLISIGCVTGIFAGVMVCREGSKVKKIEGIQVTEYDVVETVEEYQKRKAKEGAKEPRTRVRHFDSAQIQAEPAEKVKRSAWFARR